MNDIPDREKAQLSDAEQAAFTEIVEANCYAATSRELSYAITHVKFNLSVHAIDGFQRRVRQMWRTAVGA